MPCKLTFCTLSIGRLSAFELIKQKAKAHHNNYPSQSLAERRAKVKACGQKHRSALSFASFWSSKRKNKNRFLTFLIKQKGKPKHYSQFFLPVPTCNY